MKDKYLLKLSIATLILSIIGVFVVFKKLDFEIGFEELSLSISGAIIGALISVFLSYAIRNKKSKRVLITYTSSDFEEATIIKKFLIDRKVPTNIIDEFLPVGDPIADIKSIVTNSDILLIIVSKNIHKSKYYKSIISLAIRERKKIIPILVDESKIPNYIGNYAYMDIREDQENKLEKLYNIIISL